MTGGVAYEHGHRLLAGAIGLGTLALPILAWRRRDRSAFRRGAVAVVLVVVQALLGGVTVLLSLPTLVSTAHLCVSLTFLCFLLYVSAGPRASTATRAAGGASVLVALVLVGLEILIGALVRHTGSGPICAAQFPLCNGRIVPDGSQAWIHVVHRLCAAIVVAVVLVAARRTSRSKGEAARLGQSRLAHASVVLVLAQVGLGIATVLTGISPVIVTAHLGVAALLLLDLFALYLLLMSKGAPQPSCVPDTIPLVRGARA